FCDDLNDLSVVVACVF
ncbi:hypothetical protein A2U01_0078188, partial [Trifolium medium]|nr:hypothetical protein [Trifolium medium]